jgi:transposase-like protein
MLKSFKCKSCGKTKKVSDETIVYKKKLCPICLDKKYTQAELLLMVMKNK